MAPGGYMIIGNDRYAVDSCEVTYESASLSTMTNCWVDAGSTATIPQIRVRASSGTGATRMKIRAYKASTATSCSYYDNEDGWLTFGTGSSKNTWRVLNSGTSACTMQWSAWGDEDDCTYEWHAVLAKPMTAEEKKAYEEKRLKERFSQIIQGRCAPNVIVRQNTKRQPLPMPADVREQRARETLRRVIGDQKFTNFIKHGFISVKGRSGLVYQIFTGHGITHVFDQGNLVDRLCVVLQGSFPPTDSLIMRYLLILNNEQQFRSLAIKHSISGYERSHQENGPAVIKPLAEIFRELKSKVA